MARILIIDDNDLLRDTVKLMLTSGGHEVALAVNGEDGIRQFQQGPFDLVLCDLFMPEKEGLETIREIRGLSAETPIISMTGSITAVPGSSGELDPDFLRMAAALGATETIAKPFKVHDLLTLVDKCLGDAA